MRNGFWLTAGLTLLVVAGLVAVFRATAPDQAISPSQAPLVVYCAAGLKPPIEAAVAKYQQEFSVPVQIEYGGSGALVGTIGTAQRGDLFVAADEHYLNVARNKDLIRETLPLATQVAVLAVPRGNPKKIETLDDLRRDDLRIGLAVPEAAAVGKSSREMLEAKGYWDQVKSAVESRGVFKPTVSDLANDLKLGTLDVAIVWDCTVAQYPELEAIAINAELAKPQHITLGVLKFATDPTRALHLARFLAARDRGLPEFKSQHYQVVEGDPWTDRPEITLFIGGVLRPAVEETLADFQQREGVTINTVYNGCGVLVGQIKAGGPPDAYFACDRSFMNQVGQYFHPPRDISQTKMLIIVPKGNPKQLRGLADLAQPGVRVGVCNEQQSALGALAAELLRQHNLYDSIMPNVVTQVPTADLLVAQMRTGGLDAAIVYEANYRRVAEGLDAVELGVAAAPAVQPLAVSQQTPYVQLLDRLVAALENAASRDRFVSGGFEWVFAGESVNADSP